VSVCIGIDGGGSGSRAVAVDRAGRVIARERGPETRVRSGDPAAGAAALVALATRVLEEAGAAPPAASLCCALAGAGGEPERAALTAALADTGIAHRVHVVSDAEAALHDAFGDGPGIVLIAGTGSVAWGRSADGRVARAGGWGKLLDDEGSGYGLGLAALRAVLRAHDGRGRPTVLTGALLRETGLPDAPDLVRWADAADKARIAALAPAVLAAADRGDAAAGRLVEEAAAALAELALALHRTLGPWDTAPAVALAGGLVEPGAGMREAAARALAGAALPFQVLRMAVDAARGAALLAVNA
jgi:N-acetylglucosamine kinase-like BadF-type ATPase